MTVFLLAACKADPNVISDDDGTPIGPGLPLECDSLIVPNAIYSDQDGDFLHFRDSTGSEYDTLLCVQNEAISTKVVVNGEEVCSQRYEAGYATKWTNAPDIYSIAFATTLLSGRAAFNAVSVPLDDFWASAITGENGSEVYEDSITINGTMFRQVFRYDCLPDEPCIFAQSFVFALDMGLVAFHRNGKWWVKQ